MNNPVTGSQGSYSPTTIDTYKKPIDLKSNEQSANYLYGNQAGLVSQKHYLRMKQKNVNHQLFV